MNHKGVILFLLTGFYEVILPQQKKEAVLMVNQLPDSYPEALVLSADGEYYLTLTANRYTISRSSTSHILVSSVLPNCEPTHTHPAGISQNLERVAFVDNSKPSNIVVMDPFTGEIITKFLPEDAPGKYKYTTRIVVSSDGKMIILFGVKNGFTLYKSDDARNYRIAENFPYDKFEQTNLTAISPDARFLAMSNSHERGSFVVFDLIEKKKAFSKGTGGFFTSGHESILLRFYFSQDSRYLLSSDLGHKVFVHDMKGNSKRVETDVSNIFNAKISDTGDVNICTGTRAAGYLGFCLPEKESEPFVKLRKYFMLDELAGIIFPAIFAQTQSESAADLTGTSKSRWSVKNTHTKKSLSRDYQENEKAKFIVYDSSGSSPVEKHKIELQDDWYNWRKVGMDNREQNLILTDHDTFLLFKGNRMLAYDFAGKQVLACKDSLSLSGWVVDYLSGKDLVATAYNQYLSLYSNNCQNLVEVPEESGVIEEIRFAKSGKFVVTRMRSGVVKIRDTKTLKLLASVVWAGPDSWAVAAADGRYDGKGDALRVLHYVTGREVIQLSDFDKSFFTPGLAYSILGEKNPHEKPAVVSVVKVEVKKSLAGKIHLITGNDITISGVSLKMGEKVFAVVGGKKVFLKVHFPTHSGARTKVQKSAEIKLLGKGMPVFR